VEAVEVEAAWGDLITPARLQILFVPELPTITVILPGFPPWELMAA
jgi:hypothetical protein